MRSEITSNQKQMNKFGSNFINMWRLILIFIFSFWFVNLKSQSNFQKFKPIEDSIMYYLYTNADKALIYAEMYDSMSRSIDSILYKANGENFKGMAYNVKGNSDNAIEHFLKAIRLYEKSENKLKVGVAYNNLGAAYNQRDNPEATIKYYEKALSIFKELKDSSWIMKSYYNISTQYNALKKYDEDLKYKLMAMEILKTKKDIFLEGVIKANIAHTYFTLKKYDEARKTIEEYLNSGHAKKMTSIKTNALLTYAFILEAQGEVKKAIEVNLESDKLAIQNEYQDKEMKAKLNLSHLYEIAGNKSLAYDYLKGYQTLYEDYFNKEKEETIHDLLLKYDSEKKEGEIAILKVENELKDATLKGNKILNIGLLIVLFLLAFLLYNMWRLKKIKTTVNIQLEEKNRTITKALEEKNILIREIHHRVKNNLQVISSLLKLQGQHIEDETALKAIADGRSRVQSMALLHQSLYKEDNVTGVSMKKYFGQLIEGLFDSYNILDEKIQLEVDIDDIMLDIDTVIPMGLIANELISNALKHAFHNRDNGLLEVSLNQHGNELLLKVKDNGIGHNENDINNKGSFGHRLINALAEKLNADVQIINLDGTLIEIRIREFKLAA